MHRYLFVAGLAALLAGQRADAASQAPQTDTASQAPRAPMMDVEPAVTAQVAEVLERIARGSLPHELLTASADATLSTQAAEMAAQLRPCPTPLVLALLDRRTKGEDRQYQYRIDCGRQAILLDIDFNKAARINRLLLTSPPAAP